MARTFGQNQPVLLEKQPEKPEQPALTARPATPKVRPSRFGLFANLFAAALALFWVGVCAAFLFGYWGPAGLARLNLQTDALIAAAVLLPPFFFLAMAWWQLGDKDQARQWYDQAVQWMHDHPTPQNIELPAFRSEAAALLRMGDEDPATKPAPK